MVSEEDITSCLPLNDGDLRLSSSYQLHLVGISARDLRHTDSVSTGIVGEGPMTSSVVQRERDKCGHGCFRPNDAGGCSTVGLASIY